MADDSSKSMTMVQALRSAMDVMLERDDNVVVFGEDVGYFGGVFRCTEGLQAKYGRQRVFDAPISEGGLVGAAVGMGAYGLRPVVEIQFADYFYPASDQIVSEAARLRYRSAGDFTAPLTIRMPCGGGIYGGQTHSQSPEALFTHVCGIRTVMPSNPYDAKGLLISAIECNDPVVFLEPKRLYNGPFDGHHDRALVPWSEHALSQVPTGHYTVPLESARLFKPGSAVTILCYGTMVWVVSFHSRGKPPPVLWTRFRRLTREVLPGIEPTDLVSGIVPPLVRARVVEAFETELAVAVLKDRRIFSGMARIERAFGK